MGEAQDVDKQLGNDQHKLTSGVKKLKTVKHAQRLKQSCDRLVPRMNEKQKQFQEELKKSIPATQVLKKLVKDGVPLSLEKSEQMDKPLRAFETAEKKSE